ncbi:hypothetical protein BD769DRAFT_1696364 [Suillus cothurnatus]|nr:hypothetical protein BD769DRAFT_1696364 [Suillus cothurnatus]
MSARSVTVECRDKAVVIQNVATSDRHIKREQLASLLLPIEALLISPDVIQYEYLYSESTLNDSPKGALPGEAQKAAVQEDQSSPCELEVLDVLKDSKIASKTGKDDRSHFWVAYGRVAEECKDKTITFMWSTVAFFYVGVTFAAHPEHAITYFDIELAQFFLDEIPGNKYEGDSCMDDKPMSKDCSGAESAKGAIVHQISKYFKDSKIILIRLANLTIWQSSAMSMHNFEKFVGLDGIAMVNIVANPAGAAIMGRRLYVLPNGYNSPFVDSYLLHRQHLKGASTPFGGFAGSEVPLAVQFMSTDPQSVSTPKQHTIALLLLTIAPARKETHFAYPPVEGNRTYLVPLQLSNNGPTLPKMWMMHQRETRYGQDEEVTKRE